MINKEYIETQLELMLRDEDTKTESCNPFKVPDGYFDSLAENTMKRLPGEQAAVVTISRKLRPWLYAAAGVLALAVSTTVLVGNINSSAREAQIAEEQQMSNLDQAADYAMIDNYDIYALVSSDNN